MSALVTTDDIKSSALFASSEPIDGTSQFDSKVVEYMNEIQDTLVNGGSLGTRDIATSAGLYSWVINIPTTDWLWLRKFPPHAFNTIPAIIGAASSATLNLGEQIGTATLTFGSPIITFSIAPSVSVVDYRFLLQVQANGVPNPPFTVPRIAQHIAGQLVATLDAPWPQESQTVSSFALIPLEYNLPADFCRFVETPAVHGAIGTGGLSPGDLPIGSIEQLLTDYPLNNISQGPPTAAGRMNLSRIQMNRWDTYSYRIEFSYIFQPTALVAGANQIPDIPPRYRHLISTGAAMLVTRDKSDAKTAELASEFREILAHMGHEQRHEDIAGSELMGRHLYRMSGRRRRLLRTTSGLPLF